MQVNEIGYKPSFGSWDKNSRTVLKNIVKKLPAKRAEVALDHINWLEANSPYHDLCVSEMFNSIFANRKNNLLGQRREFSFGNFSRFFRTGKMKDKAGVLEETVQFIKSQNELIPQIQKTQEEIIPKLAKFINEKDYHGWEDPDGALLKQMSVQLAEIAQEEGGEKQVEALIKQIRRIHKKGKETEYVILKCLGSKFVVFTRFNKSAPKKEINNKNLPEALRKIEAFLDKQIIRKRLSEAERPVIDSACKIAGFKSQIIGAKESLYWEKRKLKRAKKEVALKKKAIRQEVFAQTRLGKVVNGAKAKLYSFKERVKSLFMAKKLSDDYVESNLKIANDVAEQTVK